MDKVSGKLTVYFEEPFWVGVFEHIENRNFWNGGSWNHYDQQICG